MPANDDVTWSEPAQRIASRQIDLSEACEFQRWSEARDLVTQQLLDVLALYRFIEANIPAPVPVPPKAPTLEVHQQALVEYVQRLCHSLGPTHPTVVASKDYLRRNGLSKC